MEDKLCVHLFSRSYLNNHKRATDLISANQIRNTLIIDLGVINRPYTMKVRV